MGQDNIIKEQVIITTPSGPSSASYVKIYRKADGLVYELDSLGTERIVNFDRLKPVFITQAGIVIHNGAADTTTNALTQNATLPYDGDYLLTLSFNYNINATNTNARWLATFDGNALDLNDRSGDPQGNNQILVTRVRNAGNTSGGAITGTGSGHKFNYCGQFLITKTAGTYPLVIDVGNQTAATDTSIWNIIAKFEIVNKT